MVSILDATASRGGGAAEHCVILIIVVNVRFFRADEMPRDVVEKARESILVFPFIN